MATPRKTTPAGDIDMTKELVIPADKPESNDVPRAQFEQLQASFEAKCKQYDDLARAYNNLQMKAATDIEVAKHFVKNAFLGIETLWPTKKGGNN